MFDYTPTDINDHPQDTESNMFINAICGIFVMGIGVGILIVLIPTLLSTLR